MGVYRGRVLAVKKLGKTSIDITRAIKKELKLVSRYVGTTALPRKERHAVRHPVNEPLF